MLHSICDNCATLRQPPVKARLKEHPRFQMHFTPSSGSWFNMVERFFPQHVQRPMPFCRKRCARGSC